ncbi:uncharacterized protein AMSG_08841 [Thecamonas trahens ATCC 50062]|uniref:Cytochrome P450 n=1 Tax=Thecamonas trahens ATCC 50062 TaxID=461836 RepID=A0A0L0DM48_THETB|nr:hypothetical protein AMSG_08841 [Thecamonas trahens ATCC 50062]KNC53340.1 hypothetical protein AMSG_08841 [Thecamonas trahens ATCC 50062]|eukprot:XP_013754388.1 hypothetical protein AMSG_08841 [Thecamonas trahens ATCC 50062]
MVVSTVAWYLLYFLAAYVVWHVLIWPCLVLVISPMRALPGPTPLPVVGTLYRLKKKTNGQSNILDLVRDWVARDSRMYCVWNGPRPAVVLCHPDTMSVVLRSSVSVSKGAVYDTIRPWLGNGLLVARGAAWHARRKLLTHAFHFSILKQSHDVVARNAAILIGKLADARSGEPAAYLDLAPFISRCTLDIICEAAMNEKVNVQDAADSPYLAAVHEASTLMFQRILSPWYAPGFLNGLLYKFSKLKVQTDAVLGTLHTFTNSVIASRKAMLAAHPLSPDDAHVFLDLLLAVRDEDGAGLTDREIREEVDTFMFEGHDTTSASIAWTLHLLSLHREWADAVFNELAAAPSFATHTATGTATPWIPSERELGSFRALHNVICESHRLYPPVPFVSRQTAEDHVVDGFRIPSGSNVSLNIYALHHNPTVWPDPERFDPSRFESPLSSPFAHIPFSAGSRNCIGRKFAEREVTTLVAAVVAAYHLAADPHHDPYPRPDLILRPANGLRVKLTPR